MMSALKRCRGRFGNEGGFGGVLPYVLRCLMVTRQEFNCWDLSRSFSLSGHSSFQMITFRSECTRCAQQGNQSPARYLRSTLIFDRMLNRRLGRQENGSH